MALKQFIQVEQPKDNLVTYTLSDGNYQKRTYENANAEDVDFTFQFKAVDSYGERSTEKAAGDSCLPIELPFKDGRLDLSKKAVSEAVNTIMAMLPEEFFNGTPCGVNLAGNGIYTLNSNGMSVSQNDIDVFVSAVFVGLKENGFDLISLRSGGQTGVDEAAVAVAHTLDIPVIIHGTADWRFRPVDGKDVSGNEHAFKERFVKDFAKIKSNAEQLVVKKTRKVSSSPNIEELLYLEMTVGGDAIDREFVYQCVQGYSSEELGSLKTSLHTRLTEFYDDLHHDGHLDDKSHKEALAYIDKDINYWLGSWALLAGKMDVQLSNYEHEVSEKVISSIAERSISSNIQYRMKIGLWAKRACKNFGLDENKLSPAVKKTFKPLVKVL